MITRRLTLWVVFATTCLLTAATDPPIANETTMTPNITGRVCMTVENFRALDDPGTFLECSPLSDEENRGFQLTHRYLGVWKERECPGEFEFDETRQKCIEKKKLRRTQANCGTPGSAPCASPCRANNDNPQVGAACNWRTATLREDPQNPGAFFQCTAQTGGDSCGEWVRMPCTENTTFNPQLQICVPKALRCRAPTEVPVCGCAANSACPGTSSCQNSICCEINIPATVQVYNNPPGLCISGMQPSGYCPCPQNAQCQPNVGCCAQAPTLMCPGGGSPVGTCSLSDISSCPSGSSCNTNVGGCCPNAIARIPVSVSCPNGQISQEPCGPLNYCDEGQGCYKGACCPMVCPQGLSANGFCSANSCSTGGSCVGGCCCGGTQPVPLLPVCSNGQKATLSCVINAQCGTGFECSNGGCCPIPFCPSGVQATNRCLIGGCGQGFVCLNSLCCPMPRCSGGVFAVRVCSLDANCGPGFECANGGCCPLPTCPNGVTASRRCGSGGCCCPSGQGCVNGACCPLPQCPTGGIAIRMCKAGAQCGRGRECSGGGCCPLPTCPGGVVAIKRCSTGGCPVGNMCSNGVCCPMPTCSATGSVAMSVCGRGNACPVGYICEGNGCCPEPLPLCPNGGRASQKCNLGSDCPPGFGCTSLGGCCLLSSEAVCPNRQNAVCQCSSSNACPAQSSCNMGTCCTNAVTVYNAVPGTSCEQPSQCNGYASNCATCQRSICVCTLGSYSNGAACTPSSTALLNRARRGCDQYGSPCKFHLSSARRKPLFAPVGNDTTTPLWFSVAGDRKCIMDDPEIDPDSTCLPSEKCIDGKCRMKLWPGEYGCQTDLECSARCPNTYCERKSDKNVPQCQCRNGLLLYGRCFEKCPSGFHESGAYCMHDDEDAFWASSDHQDALQKLLNQDQC